MEMKFEEVCDTLMSADEILVDGVLVVHRGMSYVCYEETVTLELRMRRHGETKEKVFCSGENTNVKVQHVKRHMGAFVLYDTENGSPWAVVPLYGHALRRT